MSDITSENGLISEEKAKELADSYLRNRYYDFDKITFNSVEDIQINDKPAYRLCGSVHVKSRSMFERVIHDKSASTYKFTVDIHAATGRVINYVFQ